MAVRPIITPPHPVLSQQAAEVTDFTAAQSVIADMLDTLYETDNGIGLAAPQIGESLAIVVIDLSEERNNPLVLVNPKITQGDGEVIGQEGCLSVPEVYADVTRYQSVTVEAQDAQGNPMTISRDASDDFLAIVMQHEIDHLKGTLFIDYLSPLKKTRALTKMKKALKHRD
ncbi:Peptide deformylase 2 [Vibrio stylophorae]|uniref:Peptide deformylase n=1 Tax=Vibrio stylophorae TaxID=659351 RepID=A0ABM8ZUU8_9VIBR|nr:peptide deformylase [Vibrio stylophorae]CAH0533755.1 Peptide deformylase 2 [Vibrio stylophorae]